MSVKTRYPERRNKPTSTAQLAGRPKAIDLVGGAEYLCVSVEFLRKRIADGSLPAFKLGYRTVRVLITDLDKLKKPMIPTLD